MSNYEYKYKGQTIYQEVYWELIQAARYRGHITYQEIAQLMGLPLSGNHMGKEVGQMLGEISQEEHQAGRPMLSAVAVGASGIPGEGFFGLAKEFGYEFKKDSKARRTFWEKEKREVYSAWQRKLNK